MATPLPAEDDRIKQQPAKSKSKHKKKSSGPFSVQLPLQPCHPTHPIPHLGVPEAAATLELLAAKKGPPPASLNVVPLRCQMCSRRPSCGPSAPFYTLCPGLPSVTTGWPQGAGRARG